jgi:hypothetical protein
MKRLVIALLFGVGGALPVSAVAGGVSWEFRVVEFEANEWTFRATLDPVEPLKYFPAGDCQTIHVAGAFARLRWWFSGGMVITPELHVEAVKAMKRARENAQTVRFGLLGEGVRQQRGDDRCAFESRGLVLIEENGTEGIYSVFSAP